MSGKCALVALPNADASSGLLCTTCGETFEKEPICPKQRRRTMTANKPERQPAPAQSKGQSKLSSLTEALFSEGW